MYGMASKPYTQVSLDRQRDCNSESLKGGCCCERGSAQIKLLTNDKLNSLVGDLTLFSESSSLGLPLFPGRDELKPNLLKDSQKDTPEKSPAVKFSYSKNM